MGVERKPGVSIVRCPEGCEVAGCSMCCVVKMVEGADTVVSCAQCDGETWGADPGDEVQGPRCRNGVMENHSPRSWQVPAYDSGGADNERYGHGEA